MKTKSSVSRLLIICLCVSLSLGFYSPYSDLKKTKKVNSASPTSDSAAKSPMALLLEAEFALSRQQPATALSHYSWVAHRTQNPEIQRRTTELALQYGTVTQALSAAKRWAMLDDKNVDAQLTVSAILIQMDSNQTAPYLIKINALDPQHAVDHFLRLYQHDTLTQTRSIAALEALNLESSHVALSQIFLSQDNNAQALEHTQKARQLNPHSIPAIILETQALFRLNQNAQANAFLDAQLAKNARSIDLGLFYIEFYYAQGKSSKANTQINKFLRTGSLNGVQLLHLAYLNIEAHNYKLAHTLLSKTMDFAEQQNAANYFLGRLCELENKNPEAIQAYIKVHSEPFHVIAQIRASLLYSSLNQANKGLALLENLEYDEEHKEAVALAKIEILNHTTQYSQSLALINEQLIATPNDLNLLYLRANIQKKMGNVNLAEQDLQLILSREPNHIDALNDLGLLFTQSTRYQEADNLLNQALALDPKNPAILDNLGLLALKIGNTAQAIELFTQALSLLPDPKIQQHLQNALKQP